MDLVVEYDDEVDAAYIRLSPKSGSRQALMNVIVEDDRIEGELVLDFTESGELLGLEVIGARRIIAKALLEGAKAPGEGRHPYQ